MKRIVAALVLFAVSFSCYSQGEDFFGSVTYLPKTFYVGDVVEMRVELPGVAAESLSVPDVLPRADWFFYRQVEIVPGQDGAVVRILFSSFQPGIRMIPPLQLGGIVLENIRVDTASILEREPRGLAGNAAPLYLPKPGLYLALVLGILFGIPMVLFALFRLIRGRILTAVLNARRRQPYVRLVKALKELDKRILNRDGNYFYTTLTGELKRYSSIRTGDDYSTLTGREIVILLGCTFGDEDFLPFLEGLFLYAEEVKFGGRDPYTSRKREDLNGSLSALEGLEHYYHRIWNRHEKEEEIRVDR